MCHILFITSFIVLMQFFTFYAIVQSGRKQRANVWIISAKNSHTHACTLAFEQSRQLIKDICSLFSKKTSLSIEDHWNVTFSLSYLGSFVRMYPLA